MSVRLLALFLVASVCALPSAAQPAGDLTSFPFLRLEPSARASALGGAFSAVADGDVNAVFHNPATLSPASSGIVGVSYLNHLADANAGTVAYSQEVASIGTTIGGGLRFMHWGDFDGRNAFGEPTGTFQAADAALTLSASRGFGARWRYGASVHVVHAGIETARSSAVAADLGLLYRLDARQLTVGASLRNAGVVFNDFGARDDTLPLDLQVSLTKRLQGLPLLVSVAAYDLTTLDRGVVDGGTTDHVLAHVALGGELQLAEVFRARLGYNHRRSKELALNDRFDLAGFGVGFGIVLDRIGVDYAYNSWSDLGGLHQFTLRADV